MTFVKINETLYPATISGKVADKDWDNRASKAITLEMDYATASALFVDGVAWSIVQEQEVPTYEMDENGQAVLDVDGDPKQIGTEMLNFLRGPRPLSNYDISFLNDRFSDGHQVPFSYFKGAVPANDYTPDTPFTITVESGAYSDANKGYKKLFIKSGGADSPREIVLRQLGDGRWMLWDQFLLVSIRKGKSEDPWA